MIAKHKIIFTVVSLLAFLFCACDDDLGKTDNLNEVPEFELILDWGKSLQEIKSCQKEELLVVSTDTLLRYADDVQGFVANYKFTDNKLVTVAITYSKIDNINVVVNSWLKEYIPISESSNALFCISKDGSTVALGEILQGSNCKYASVIWTYIDEDEDNVNAGYDFSPSGTINGYDYVDLGIGVGWAVQNLGASSPSEQGDYYMWGETTVRSNCWWSNYSLYTGGSNYLDDTKFYTPYSNISETRYDAVSVKMGDKWRMPTRAEASSLITNCIIEIGEYDGVDGFVITGPSGKSIFIPRAGNKKKNEIRLSSSALIWTSANYSNMYSYNICINSVASGAIEFIQKYYGLQLRGVINLE